MELLQWMERLSERLGTAEALSVDHEQVQTILDLAREAAHQIERPAAPLTTFLVGVAVGRGAALAEAARAATELIEDGPVRPAGAQPGADA